LISCLIISVLCAVAIPFYQTYMLRAKVTEGIALTGGMKLSIAEYYSIYGHFPANIDQIDNIQTSGTYVENINMNNGAILVEFPDMNGSLLSVRPALAENDLPKVIKWHCGYAQAPAHFVIQGENHTDMLSQYLVSTCR
ncbi:MAG: pilin, partial [Candidatus Parabeggiatoa sp.]|nr:pilin [Candidatus Parabeggiatoa sp.]